MRRERRYLGSRESRAMAFFHGQDSHCAPAFSLFLPHACMAVR